ncbi:flavodoxin family protein [Pseudarthrobacter sp. NPDC092419]|uniref:flavodoxin family protein n=1 Tax=Pseudarthrobacter sp. NPDC092419 TaxID=3364414 RepID=UPI0037F49074
MKATVVYESMYGNTHSIALAIAEGLGSAGAADVVSAQEATRMDLAGLDLLVVGGPTHAHGMTRAQTRHAAVSDSRSRNKGLTVDPSAKGLGLRDWLDSLGPGAGKAAAFDTRVDMPALLTGHASKTIGKNLKEHGFELVADPESFLVSGDSGLLPGELDRARAWGQMLASTLK